MDRRNFLKTIAAGTAGAAMLPSCVSMYYPMYTGPDSGYGVHRGTVPIDIYCCDLDIPPRTNIRSMAESYEGPFREDLLMETDYKKKYTLDFIEKFMEQMSGYVGYLSSGEFGVELRNADVIKARWKGSKVYNEVTTPTMDESFRMIITTMTDSDICGEYFAGGLFFVRPFNVQIDRDGQRYFDPTPIHEMFHRFFNRDYVHNIYSRDVIYPKDREISFEASSEHVHSLSGKSVMYPNGRKSSLGLSRMEFRMLDWKPVKPIDVHPLYYRLDKNGNIKKVWRT